MSRGAGAPLAGMRPAKTSRPPTLRSPDGAYGTEAEL